MPPGGWWFSQAIEGGQPFRIDGQTYRQLEDRVFEFRLSHIELVTTGSADRDSVRADIRHWICSRYPEQCVGSWTIPERDRPVRESSMGYSTPIQRIEDWLKKVAFSDLQFKDASRAMAAAETCASCPQNIGWKVSCVPCSDAVQRRILRYKGDRSTQLDGRLQACRCFGHHNELAVWLNDTMSEARETPPESCWNRK